MAQALAFRIGAAFYPMRRAAAWLGGLSARQRWLASFLLGVIAAGAMPPLDVTPLLVVSFSGLVWILDGTPTRRAAFAVGWWFGFGFLLAGLYWIAVALTVDIAKFWWLMPFAAAGLPAALALFSGLAVLTAYAARFTGVSRVFALALAWSVCEWLRGHLFTGFPWNLVGYTWAGGFPGSLGVLQATSAIGVYGLSFVTVALAALPALMADPIRRRWVPMAVTLGVPVLLGVAGAARLAALSTEPTEVRLRLVQPSIEQSLKLDPAAQRANFEKHLALSAQPGDPAPKIVIWPEAAAHFYLNRHEEARAVMARVLPPGGLLAVGTLRTDPPPGPALHAWNSLGVLDDAGTFLASYDKFHLVPFGEYVPFRNVLPIEAVAAGLVDFSAGPGPRTLHLPGVPPVGPLICYEVIFPAAVVDPADRPAWLLNLTNDAWYGHTSGPYQHFAISRVRAVEEGLPLVRVANNGISGVVDALGRVTARLPLNAVGVLDTSLPAPLPPTLYARFGDAAYWLLVALSMLVIGFRRGR